MRRSTPVGLALSIVLCLLWSGLAYGQWTSLDDTPPDETPPAAVSPAADGQTAPKPTVTQPAPLPGVQTPSWEGWRLVPNAHAYISLDDRFGGGIGVDALKGVSETMDFLGGVQYSIFGDEKTKQWQYYGGLRYYLDLERRFSIGTYIGGQTASDEYSQGIYAWDKTQWLLGFGAGLGGKQLGFEYRIFVSGDSANENAQGMLLGVSYTP